MMKTKTTFGIALLLQVILHCTFCKDIPSFVHLCKRSDPELAKCIMKTVNEIRPYLIKGIPEMNIPPGNPLRLIDAAATTGGRAAVTLTGEAWNQTAIGLLDFDLKDMSIDLDNAKCSITVEFPEAVRLMGDYKFKGKVLLFDLDTVGQFDINATDSVVTSKLFGKYYTKKQAQYLEFENVDLKLQVRKDIKVHFTNLINGNEALSETVNQAVNENINLLLDELLPIIEKTFAGIVRQYFNKFFRQFPVDQLFPKD